MRVINSIGRNIFKAVHEGKWLYIEYKNKSDTITKYWISIKNVNTYKKSDNSFYYCRILIVKLILL